MLVTQDLNLSQGSVVQFFIRFGCQERETAPPYSPHRTPRTPHSPILLQYSTNGGISWGLMAELTPPNPHAPHTTHHYTLKLPDLSKTNSSRLRWYQPSHDGTFTSQWAIDQIGIGSNSEGLSSFTNLGTSDGWLYIPGSLVQQVCQQEYTSVHFNGNDGYRMAETPDIQMTQHTYIQYTASLACKESNVCFKVRLEYSLDHGSTWNEVRSACLPSDPTCTEYWPSSDLVSDLFVGSGRVTIPLPRKCYQGWTGEHCQVPLSPLPTFLVSDFEDEDDWQHWHRVVGCHANQECGVIAAGRSLQCDGTCSRYLETQDLDLRDALFVQFDLRTGCQAVGAGAGGASGGAIVGGDNTILLQASCNAGITWNTLKKLIHIHHTPTYVWVEIPNDLRCNGGRVRWWQPSGGGAGAGGDWGVDAVVVGGRVEPTHTLTYTHTHQLRPPLWLRRYNALIDQYCDHSEDLYVMMSTPSEPSLLQTTDIQIGVTSIVSFIISIGCDADWDNAVPPVRLQYTTDFGYTWLLVRDSCLSGNTVSSPTATTNHSCQHSTEPSVYYAPLRWQRFVYSLKHIAPSKYVRFRWIQSPSSDVLGRHRWALRDVYIGPPCPRHCLGRGSCIGAGGEEGGGAVEGEGVCRCDEGYTGSYCQHLTVDNVPYIRDQFTGGEFKPHFAQVQGGLLSGGCGGMEEPPAATFQSPRTPRTLLTRPIDTRSAKFVHFTAQIGSVFGSGVCFSPTHRLHNVLLQYSVNGGIDWELLRELDYNLYKFPNKEYILLPHTAMTPATVFR
ncbi:hypothetical protein Pcinc_041952 [Petrolisthes cinctipes]|uniref:Reelin n=1 Tax=Petrolisthes cinctipes TaxID=88211 RepID=A0AAE1EHB3_PETCI|nr:hypothetical protein Pcinc_041952 [Petrolisthes cinctipes]